MTTPATILGDEITEPRETDLNYAAQQLIYQMPHELRNYVLKYHEGPVGSSSLVCCSAKS